MYTLGVSTSECIQRDHRKRVMVKGRKCERIELSYCERHDALRLWPTADVITSEWQGSDPVEVVHLSETGNGGESGDVSHHGFGREIEEWGVGWTWIEREEFLEVR
jgi:hypothetical protein